jgi:hypothetical protein
VGSGLWGALTDVVAQATNHVESIVDPFSTSHRIYRLVTPQQP